MLLKDILSLIYNFMVVLIFLAGDSFHLVKVTAVNFNEMLISQSESLCVCVNPTKHKPGGAVYVSKPGQSHL